MDTFINYQSDLNPAQLTAATTLHGPVLVIAGAGSGKTRTIVYRLARLIESGIPASSILLLTFTRKAAQEMLERAKRLLHQHLPPHIDGYDQHATQRHTLLAELAAVQGGTFHSYAYSVLRIFPPAEFAGALTVMDSHDILAALQHCRDELQAGKGDRSFPKNQTINSLLSKSRNKELPLEEVLKREANHLLPHASTMAAMGESYTAFKQSKSLLDYDDLLFSFEKSLRERPEVLAYCQRRHQFIMIDEYQDTNPVQARIAGLIAGTIPPLSLPAHTGTLSNSTLEHAAEYKPPCNIMVVGDDAQSIYAFRGADVHNILRFPNQFPGTEMVRLEENYRSTQPILDLTNAILEHATEGFRKHLFTSREGKEKPLLIRPLSDRTQAQIVAARIIELLRVYPPQEIAVLFRAGFHSYGIEIQLNKLGIRFRKYGGIKYTEAAHIKDAISYMRLVLNPLDFTAFSRMAEMTKGVGKKTCLKIYEATLAGNAELLHKITAKYPDLQKDLAFIDNHRAINTSPAALLTDIIAHYQPKLEFLYPDDYPKRLQGLEQLVQIAASYTDLDLFIADLSLDDPMEEESEPDSVTLSTIHSAKGLEWSAVLVIDLVEERFPSRHALVRPEDFEEERRLMYVACTRAKDHLEMYVPGALYDKGSGGSIPAVPSPFVREMRPELYTEYQEGYTGALVKKELQSLGNGQTTDPFSYTYQQQMHASPTRTPKSYRPLQRNANNSNPPQNPTANIDEISVELPPPTARPEQCGFCHHKIFGRGKVVQHLPPDKYRVNFPGVGLKVILAAYLTLEK